jgi:DNA-binding response OmpR family regulator
LKSSEAPAVTILLVEDNPADVLFLTEAIEATRIPVDLRVVDNGADALRFLSREARFSGAPRPNVVILDLNLPVKNGKEVLAEMMKLPDLRNIPVAILTTSTSEEHLVYSYTRGLCLYFTKTDEFRKLQLTVERIVSHASSARKG